MIPNPFRQGLYVAFEGPNFCGKSTYMELVAVEFHKLYGSHVVPYHSVRKTKEPNKDAFWGRRIYQELKKKDGLHITDPFGFQTWYACDSKENMKHIVIPALRSGQIVLSDRCRVSMVHGALVSEALQPLMKMHESIMGEHFIWPDIVFIFDVTVGTALTRLVSKRVVPDVQETQSELERTIPMYHSFMDEFPDANCRLVDVNAKDPKTVADEIMAILLPMVGERGY